MVKLFCCFSNRIIHQFLFHKKKDFDIEFQIIIKQNEKKETNISAKSTAKKTIDGKTLEECLAKASDLLKIEPTKIKYKILQQSKAGVLGIGAKKCIIEIET